MAKYLAIMGSYRRDKNTNQALDMFLKGVSKNGDTVEKIYLRDKDIKHCIGCDYCGKTGQCVFKDDMQEIYKKLDSCDVLVVGAPIYFNTVNSLTKTFIDRCQRYWGIKYVYGRDKIKIPNKIGMFIGVGGAEYRNEQFFHAIPVMDMFFKVVNAEFRGAYLISETDKNEVNEKKEICKELEKIGENFLNSKKFFIQKIE